MRPIKFLLSLADFFVYINIKSILFNTFCFGLGTNALSNFVCWIKQFIFETCTGVPP